MANPGSHAKAPRLGPSLASAPAPSPVPGPAMVADSVPALTQWLAERRNLMAELAAELRSGFQAVAAFDAAAYLDCIERQEAYCQRIGRLDRRMPAPQGGRPALEQAAAELRRMNAELKQLAEVQTALIDHGGRSMRCFQRVWAMGASGYEPPK